MKTIKFLLLSTLLVISLGLSQLQAHDGHGGGGSHGRGGHHGEGHTRGWKGNHGPHRGDGGHGWGKHHSHWWGGEYEGYPYYYYPYDPYYYPYFYDASTGLYIYTY
ncbi:hypothetical protein [Parachlamydia sp. AcF125]|uniref:hypothetical protein n=1 Tax=Parachlamydia sp. AcF125 TaxID=2795736 RepID=UPI001BC989F0|nr:hypothetical protein [Parachlamydia sp. AcF125]MBS4167575.1 hypothetical protein [Parachlamydia sp. AcF125]